MFTSPYYANVTNTAATAAFGQYSPASPYSNYTGPCQCAECHAQAHQPSRTVISSYTHSPYATPAPQVHYSSQPPAMTANPLPERSHSYIRAADWSYNPLPPAAFDNSAYATPFPAANRPQSPPNTPPPETAQSKAARPMMVVSLAMLEDTVGRMNDLARTPTGSSFLQAALRDRDPAAHSLVLRELRASFGELLLDAHACYVVKALMEHMSHEQLLETVSELAEDEQLLFSLCTHTLHSRRMVQYILETLTGPESNFLAKLMKKRCCEIAMTQQGCIAMQRTLDRCTLDEREEIFNDVRSNVVEFSMDPFANYVVQYMLEVGNKDLVSKTVVEAFRGRVVELACNKFASNVIEKCLFHVDGEAQHALLSEMYAASDDMLVMMLDDSFGNYIIQSSIALATFRDVWMISERLHPILQRVPYGYKIESRLARRLKGKTAMGPRGRS